MTHRRSPESLPEYLRKYAELGPEHIHDFVYPNGRLDLLHCSTPGCDGKPQGGEIVWEVCDRCYPPEAHT